MRTLGALPDLLELLKVVDTVVPSAAGTRTSTAKGTDPSGGDGSASEDDARQAGMQISHGRQSVARRNRRGATYGRGG